VGTAENLKLAVSIFESNAANGEARRRCARMPSRNVGECRRKSDVTTFQPCRTMGLVILGGLV
jgi:hypothetical protein